MTGTAGTSYEVPRARWPSTRAASGIWAVVGSAHRLSGTHKPHNSAYVIDDGGNVVDRYDKRFCSGDVDEETGDLAHYSPGDHFSVWDIDGVRCAALICYDYRFPELHRQYNKLGAELVFHSFHAGHMSPQRLAEIDKRIGPELRALNPALPHPPRYNNARGHYRRRRFQPHLVQLPQYLGAAKLLAAVFRPGGRDDSGACAAIPRACPSPPWTPERTCMTPLPFGATV